MVRKAYWGAVGTCVVILVSGNARAQSSLTNFHVGASDRGDAMNKMSGTRPTPLWSGQLYCPVTGAKLGTNGKPPVPVQTTIGEWKPGPVASFLGKKPSGGAVIYVCSPEYVATVRANPEAYLEQVKADKAAVAAGHYTYATAPAQRPAPMGDPKAAVPAVQPAALQSGAAPQ